MAQYNKHGLIAVFEEFYDDLLRFLQWRTGDAELAADLAQDTYLRLVAIKDRQAEITNARGYILRVASNLAIDHLRRESRIGRQESEQDDSSHIVDPAPIADAQVLAREQLRLLDEALQALPPKPRRALLLHRVSGWTQAQIAADLEVSESMVIKYIAQALRHCREWRDRAEVGESQE